MVSQNGRELLKGFFLRPLTRLRDEALKPGHARPYKLLGTEFLTGELVEQGRFIVFQGSLEEPRRQGVKVVLIDLAIAEMRLRREEMILPGLRPPAVGGEYVGRDAQLVGDKAHRIRGHTAEIVWHKAHEAERTELEGIAEAIMRLTGVGNTASIPLGQRKERDEILIGNDVRKPIAPGTFGLGEELNRHDHLRVDGNHRLGPRLSWRKRGGCILA
jgi:hypothetical protein